MKQLSQWVAVLLLAAGLCGQHAYAQSDAQVPYSTGFETTDDTDWNFVNGTPNQWHIGTATNNGGSRGLYISNNGGTSNAYTAGSSSISFVCRFFSLDAGDYDLSFDWKCNGEGNYDFLRVFLCPNEMPSASSFSGFGAPIYRGTTPTGWHDLADTHLNQQTTWQTANRTFSVSASGTYALVFMWYNDDSQGSNPPAAIDNVVLTTHVPPATIPFYTGFDPIEGGQQGWRFNNGSTNKWIIGQDAHYNWTDGLYISNNNSSNAYTVNQTNTSFAYRAITFDAAGSYDITFHWRCAGEYEDFMRVLLCPEGVTPSISAFTSTTAYGLRESTPAGWVYVMGGLNGQSDWQYCQRRHPAAGRRRQGGNQAPCVPRHAALLHGLRGRRRRGQRLAVQ